MKPDGQPRATERSKLPTPRTSSTYNGQAARYGGNCHGKLLNELAIAEELEWRLGPQRDAPALEVENAWVPEMGAAVSEGHPAQQLQFAHFRDNADVEQTIVQLRARSHPEPATVRGVVTDRGEDDLAHKIPSLRSDFNIKRPVKFKTPQDRPGIS